MMGSFFFFARCLFEWMLSGNGACQGEGQVKVCEGKRGIIQQKGHPLFFLLPRGTCKGHMHVRKALYNPRDYTDFEISDV